MIPAFLTFGNSNFHLNALHRPSPCVINFNVSSVIVCLGNIFGATATLLVTFELRLENKNNCCISDRSCMASTLTCICIFIIGMNWPIYISNSPHNWSVHWRSDHCYTFVAWYICAHSSPIATQPKNSTRPKVN